MINVALPLRRELDFTYGLAAPVSARIRRVIAANPSPFTLHGTGTYLVGRGDVCVIDPGPDLAEHIGALEKALAGERLTHILITHTHLDHSPAAAALKAMTGAATYGFGPHGGAAHGAARADGPPVEEGADYDFTPDVAVGEGDVVAGDGWTLEAVHTPGHTSNHLCYALREERALFSGDHVMGWSTTVISPPDGDMGAYLASLDKLLPRDDRTYWPTHGPPVTAPQALVRAFIAHRRVRETEILGCLRRGVGTIPEIVAAIYVGAPRTLHRAAGRSVLAHLIHLVEQGRAVCEGALGEDAPFAPP